MTISVTVKNIDSRETAIIQVKHVWNNGTENRSVDLKGGEESELYVTHDSATEIVVG